MDPLIVVAVAVLTLLIGGAVGWFLGSRPASDWKARHSKAEVEAKEQAEKIKKMTTDLAVMSERERNAAKANEEREAQFQKELKRLAEAEDKLQVKFQEIGDKLLKGAGDRLLSDAQKRLEELNKESLSNLEKKVAPVGETLERYRKRVEEIEKANAAGFHQLQGVLGEVREGQQRVIDGAKEITTTLRGAPKAGGDWGELQFENLLESCNLHDRTDFDCQVSVKGDEGVLRADAVINIPGGRKLVVDIKNVFNTYKRANETSDEEERRTLLKAHAREIRHQIDDLASKRYQDFVEGSADFVVMFIPGEHVLYSALTEDHGLLEYAMKKRIALASPLNFISIALIIATIWRQAGFEADAKEIEILGKKLYDQLGTVAGHISNLRKSLRSTNSHFDSLVGSFDRNMRSIGERFEQLSVDTSAKDLLDAPPLNVEPRKLVNFPDADDEASKGAAPAAE